MAQGFWRSIQSVTLEYDFASAGGSVNGQLVEADGLETAVDPLNLLGENCSMPSFGLAAAGRVSVDVILRYGSSAYVTRPSSQLG